MLTAQQQFTGITREAQQQHIMQNKKNFICVMQAVRARFQLPLGAIAHPFAEPPGDSPLPVVQLENYGIIRCRRCRTYINPFMQWSEDGRLAHTPLYACFTAAVRCTCNEREHTSYISHIWVQQMTVLASCVVHTAQHSAAQHSATYTAGCASDQEAVNKTLTRHGTEPYSLCTPVYLHVESQ